MQADVVIVGAGPAGTAAAHYLAGRGRNVIVIERLGDGHYDRYHRICGACASAKAFDHLALREDEILNRVTTLRINWPDGQGTALPVDGYIIDRPRLLHRLREEAEVAGVTFIKDSVVSVNEEKEYYLLLASGRVITAKYVIGADGAFSVVRKQLFGTRPAHLQPVEMRTVDTPAAEGVIEFDAGPAYGEMYRWVFPYGQQSNHGAPHTLLCEGPCEVRFLPVGCVPLVVKGRALLVGDAAGMANAISFGGLRVALLAARKAAEAVLADDPDEYDRWWRHNIRSSPRFLKVHDRLTALAPADFAALTEPLHYRSVWSDGIHAFGHHPGRLGTYFGFWLALRCGW